MPYLFFCLQIKPHCSSVIPVFILFLLMFLSFTHLFWPSQLTLSYLHSDRTYANYSPLPVSRPWPSYFWPDLDLKARQVHLSEALCCQQSRTSQTPDWPTRSQKPLRDACKLKLRLRGLLLRGLFLDLAELISRQPTKLVFLIGRIA